MIDKYKVKIRTYSGSNTAILNTYLMHCSNVKIKTIKISIGFIDTIKFIFEGTEQQLRDFINECAAHCSFTVIKINKKLF